MISKNEMLMLHFEHIFFLVIIRTLVFYLFFLRDIMFFLIQNMQQIFDVFYIYKKIKVTLSQIYLYLKPSFFFNFW